MVTVEQISYADIREHPELLAEYAAECAWLDMGAPNPQWDIYAAMETAGVSLGLAVYVDGVMAGFASVILSILPHYGVKVATLESLFVGKAFRRKGAGTQLIAGVRDAARFAQCKRLFYSAPAGGQLEALLGKRLARTNSIYCETLA